MFLAGAANALAFAPLNLWPVQLVCLTGLFVVLAQTSTVSRIRLWTWLYCNAWLFFGVIWLTVTMYRYGDMPVWLAFLAVALFTSCLALIPAFLMGLAKPLALQFCQRFFPLHADANADADPNALKTRETFLLFLAFYPLCWSLAEWVRGWLFTGFPWLVSGYAHTNSPLAGYAPVIGVYGISWLVALLAGAIVVWRRNTLFFAAGILLIGTGLQHYHWTAPSGAPITVRLLQGNVDQNIKFEQEHIIDSLQFYYHAILAKPADLIVTPESALPVTLANLPEAYIGNLQTFAMHTQSHIALGLFGYDGTDRYSNSVFGIAPTLALYRYNKHHLVPFGEFKPWGFAWFYQFMRIPMGDLERGALLSAPFAVKDQQILPTICYEDVFGEEIAARIADRATNKLSLPSIMLNMTNLAWFGDSWALPQHLQIAQMRTLEMGRPMLRSTNTGATALINAQGKVEQQLTPFTRGELDVTVQGYQGLTPYILYGNRLWLGCMLLALMATLIATIFITPKVAQQRPNDVSPP